MSSLRHVSDGDGALLLFRSFARKISDKATVEVEERDDVAVVSGSPSEFWVVGKLVFAFLPFIKMAALSYAWAASSAVSNVPSHTLLFLHVPIHRS